MPWATSLAQARTTATAVGDKLGFPNTLIGVVAGNPPLGPLFLGAINGDKISVSAAAFDNTSGTNGLTTSLAGNKVWATVFFAPLSAVASPASAALTAGGAAVTLDASESGCGDAPCTYR